MVSQGLDSYPNEPRLQQLLATLHRAQAEAERQASRMAPKDPPAAPPASPAPPAPGSNTPPPAREHTVSGLIGSVTPLSAPPPLPTGEIGSGVIPPMPRSQAVEDQPTVEMPLPAELRNLPPLKQAPESVEVKPPRPQPPPSKPAGSPPPANRNRNMIAIGAVAAVLVLAAVLYPRLHRSSAAATPPASATAARYTVHLRSNPPGASISVNGQPCGNSACDIDLAAGDYRAEASLPDYQPVTMNFTVGQGSPPEIALTLVQAPPLLTVSTDFTQGTLLLDNVPAGQMQGGDVEIPKLAPGAHTLFVQNGAFRASVPLEIADGAMPKVTGPIQTQGMQGVVVVHTGGQARVYSSAAGAKVTLDGNPVGDITPEGVELKDLVPGTHEIGVTASDGQTRKLALDAGPATTILASLVTNANLGVLTVLAGQDGADVYINGDKYRRQTKNGRLQIYLPPKIYTVRVQKDGFAPSDEQSVQLQKGQEARLQFSGAAEGVAADPSRSGRSRSAAGWNSPGRDSPRRRILRAQHRSRPAYGGHPQRAL